jgi:uncharacterized membrane protein
MITLLAALGSGLVAGVFFAFSSFVMPALARLPAAQGIAAMNSINVLAINRWFMSALFGTAVLCLVLAVQALFVWSEPGAKYRFFAGVVYIAGAIAVTRAFNMPRNDALAALTPDAAGSASLWGRYLVEWCAWNHVRGVLSFVAALLFTLALARPRMDGFVASN